MQRDALHVLLLRQEVILLQIQMFKFFRFFYVHYMGWIKPKNHLTLLSL